MCTLDITFVHDGQTHREHERHNMFDYNDQSTTAAQTLSARWIEVVAPFGNQRRNIV